MPELPEVETVVRRLRPQLLGRRIVAFETRWARNCTPNPQVVRTAAVGARITALTRRAKYIVAALDRGGALLVHLRMSGRFAWQDECTPGDLRHVRATFEFDSGRTLYFCDARKFGRVVFAADMGAVDAALGIEPLERSFTPAVLGELLRDRRRRLKPLLLDQAFIAGLGNIYTDEALFAAGLHPLRRADRLDPDDVRRLHAAIRGVLKKGIRHNGTSIDWIYPEGRMQRHLRVYGRGGEPCRRCGAAIQRLRVGQRSTHVCPRCQPRRGPARIDRTRLAGRA